MHYSEPSENLEGQKMFQILTEAKRLEASGQNIIHFEIGDPDFDTPKHVVDRCVAELKNGNTHYTSAGGLESFKKAAAERTYLSRGFRPSQEQILVTPGANIQIYFAMACIANPGDEIITIDPCFVSYKSIIKFLGIKGVFAPLREENKFRLDPKDIKKLITKKTKAILINSPHNPTGSVMTGEEIKEVYDLAKKYDLWLLSDEVYGRMVYDDDVTKFSSPSSFDFCKERTVVIHSFSKSYAMTGWRVGAITAPEELTRRMTLLMETLASCVSPFIQASAEEAIVSNQDYISEMINTFRVRRDLMHKELQNIPLIDSLKPEGAFYIFSNIKKTGLTDIEFSDRLLKEYGVASCPGSFFGNNGKGYVRFCFATSEGNILEGASRLKKFISCL